MTQSSVVTVAAATHGLRCTEALRPTSSCLTSYYGWLRWFSSRLEVATFVWRSSWPVSSSSNARAFDSARDRLPQSCI